MIGAFSRAVDGFFGRGEAAVTVPPLDGALRPNRRLDEAPERLALEGVDCLAVAGGQLYASAGSAVWLPGPDGWAEHRRYEAPVNALAEHSGGLAVALADGSVRIEGGTFDGQHHATGLPCITALAAEGDALLATNGSDRHTGWQHDLLERGASGSLWRIGPDGAKTRLAGNLAWPAGVAADPAGPVVAEAWRHRLIRTDGTVLHADLPGYPGRLSRGADGWWLAMFAPRSQLVEFVLREPGYRKRMMAEVPQPYWVAPKLRAGRSFYESLQGGGVKQLGMLKPWAPTLSAGLCVRLDGGFQPRSSLQSRADGATHGVTSAAEHAGKLYVAARGDGVTAALPLEGQA